MSKYNIKRGIDPRKAASVLSTARKIKKHLDKRADDYLAGKYDPKKAARKNIMRGATTLIVAASLLTGVAFDGPADINEEQAASNYNQPPIVMEIDEFANAPVDEDADDADEEKSSRSGFMARFRQAILSMPQSVRLLIVTPLWLLGTALMTVIAFLWNVIFASPLGAFIASFAIGLAVLLALFTTTAKALFPDIPVKDLLSRNNIIIIAISALLLSGIDAVAPLYWHEYPLAAALVKLVLGGTVIGILSVKTKNLFRRISGHGLAQ